MRLGADIVEGVAQRLAEHAGLELPAWVVEARAAARIAALEISPAEYVALIRTIRGAGELDELIESVRVGESRLFRHRPQIAALANTVATALRQRQRKTVRVWSAGCAAGEEPYTLAAVLSRALPGVTISITATDVSADALEVARRGRYPAAAWSDIPETWRDAFEHDGEQVRVRPEIVKLVRFERGNLADPFAPAMPRACDVVWCRNVLIYFTPAARKKVLERLIAATLPGGFLFVGYSESLRDVAELEPVRDGDAVFYVRREYKTERSGGLPPITHAESVAAPRTPTPAGGVLVVHGVRRTPAAGVPVVVAPPPAPRPAATPERLVPVEHEDWTPAPIMIPDIPVEDTLVLRGHPAARVVTAELTARLAIAGLRRLVIDLDGAELLDDDLAPVIRRASAAARAAHVVLAIQATRTGTRRWIARHELSELALGDEAG